MTTVSVSPPPPPPRGLTLQQVACLKTALAMVVIKRRLIQQSKNDNKKQCRRFALPQPQPPAAALTNHATTTAAVWEHVNYMMHLAMQRVEMTGVAATGTVAHLYQQLVSLLNDNDQSEAMTTWMRNTLMDNDNNNNQAIICMVWHGLLEQGQESRLAVVLLSVLVDVFRHALEKAPHESSASAFSSDTTSVVHHVHLLEHTLDRISANEKDVVMTIMEGLLPFVRPLDSTCVATSYAQHPSANRLLVQLALTQIWERTTCTWFQQEQEEQY